MAERHPLFCHDQPFAPEDYVPFLLLLVGVIWSIAMIYKAVLWPCGTALR